MSKLFLVLSLCFSFSAFAQTSGAWQFGDGGLRTSSENAIDEKKRELDRLVNSDTKTQTNTARPSFVSLFKKTQTALEKGKLDDASVNIAKLHELKDLTPYEESRLYLLEYWYYGKKGDKTSENESAKKLMQKGFGHIDADPFVEAGIRLLKRQYNQQDLGGAIETLGYLRQEPKSLAELNLIDSAVKRLDDVSTQTTDVSQKIRTDDSGIWSTKLLKQYFFFGKINGELSNIDFNCENKQVSVNYKADSVMATPDAWGKCNIKVNATPNTSFDFIQLQNKPQ